MKSSRSRIYSSTYANYLLSPKGYNSKYLYKGINDNESRQKLLDYLKELVTIDWTHENSYKGIRVNTQHTIQTDHPYIQWMFKKDLIKMYRDSWFGRSARTYIKYKQEIIMATKYITEVLKEINQNPDLFNREYKKVGNGGPLGVLFGHAFTKQGKFLLPDGEPPYKPSAEPLGMTPAQFITEIRKFQYFCNTRLSPNKRELLFVQLCECIHPDEVKILMAVKDQKLHELYPNITPEAVAKAGFIDPNDMIEVKPKEKKPSKKGKETGVSVNLQEGESLE